MGTRIPCPDDHRCPRGSAEPILCGVGEVCQKTGSYDLCDAGYYCPSSDEDEKIPCEGEILMNFLF